MSMRSQIEEMRLHNPYIHKALCMKEKNGHTYEQALEMMVIALAERGDDLQKLAIHQAQKGL